MYMRVAEEEQFRFGIRAIRRYIFRAHPVIILRLGIAGFVIFKLNIICDLDTCRHDMIRPTIIDHSPDSGLCTR